LYIPLSEIATTYKTTSEKYAFDILSHEENADSLNVLPSAKQVVFVSMFLRLIQKTLSIIDTQGCNTTT